MSTSTVIFKKRRIRIYSNSQPSSSKNPKSKMSRSLRRRRNQLLLTAGAAISLYASFKLMSKTRDKLNNLINSISLLTNSFTSSAETIELLSTDLNVFIHSSTDQRIPSSLIQLSKLLHSNEFSSSISKISEAATVGFVKGVVSETSKSTIFKEKDKLFHKLLLSESGSGFVSLMVGSLAKNLVLGYYSAQNEKLVDFMYSDIRCKDFIAECVQVAVKNIVTVYLDKRVDGNIHNEFLAGVLNDKHEGKVKDLLVSVCNGAVETFVRTSHQILMVGSGEEEQRRKEGIKEIGRWVSHVSATLAIPSNIRLVLDLTGRVTFETVKSFLEFVVRKACARSMILSTICLVVCLHALALQNGSDSCGLVGNLMVKQ